MVFGFRDASWTIHYWFPTSSNNQRKKQRCSVASLVVTHGGSYWKNNGQDIITFAFHCVQITINNMAFSWRNNVSSTGKYDLNFNITKLHKVSYRENDLIELQIAN